jgi:Uncharacterized ACR, COG1753.
MSSKTISLKEETYNQLDRAKGPDESFSDAIDRLLGTQQDRHPLSDLAGLDADVESIQSRSETFRDNVDQRMGDQR